MTLSIHNIKKSERNSNVELLRFVLMIGVCVQHMLVHGLSLKDMGTGNILPEAFDLLLLVIVAPAVNCFMFISGYYGIRFSRKKILTLSIQAFIIMFIVVVLRNGFGMGGGELTKLYRCFPPVSVKAWWFLTEYVTIMLLSPFINNSISNIPRRTFEFSLCGLAMINCYGLWVTQKSTGSSLLGLLFVYLVARYLAIYKVELTLRRSFALLAVSTILLFTLTYTVHITGHTKYSWVLLWYCNPLIILQAIALFFTVRAFRQTHIWIFNWVGAHCFAIYLFTECFGQIQYRFWASLYREWTIIAALVVIFLSCLLIMIGDIVVMRITTIVRGYIQRIPFFEDNPQIRN